MTSNSSFNPSLSASNLDPSSFFPDKDQLRQHLLPTLKNWFTSNNRQVHVLAITPGGGKTYTIAKHWLSAVMKIQVLLECWLYIPKNESNKN